MIINVQSETLLLILRSFLSGIVLGVIYDVFTVALKMPTGDRRALVKVISSVLLFLFDFVFCLLCAAVSLLLMYYSNRGFFRAFVFAFMLLGFLCFRCSLGILFRKLLSAIYRLIWRIIQIATTPLIFLKNKLILAFRLTIGKILGKIVLWVRIAKSRRAERLAARVEAQSKEKGLPETPQGMEDFVYVGKNAGYKRNGRIKF